MNQVKYIIAILILIFAHVGLYIVVLTNKKNSIISNENPFVLDETRKVLENKIDSFFNIQPFDVLVVGAGLSGSVIAERHANKGDKVLVIERRSHIGGNCYDYIDEKTNILIHKYGAHLFHTNDENVWQYINKFSKWKRFDHFVLGYVEDKYVPIPVNINTVNKLFDLNIQTSDEMDKWLKHHQIQFVNPSNSEEMALSRVGMSLYLKIFKSYTEKQWETNATNLDPSVTARIPIRNNFDNRYFSDKYQALPENGYTDFIKSLLNHPNIVVATDLDYFDFKSSPLMTPSVKTYYTGPIDRFFETQLEYRSLTFERLEYLNHSGYVLPSPVVNYPSLDYQYTREVEYKHLLHQKSQHSVVYREYSSSNGEPFYPVPTQRNKELYSHLKRKTRLVRKNTTFVGRLANYKYFNMDEAIANALKTFQMETRTLHVITTKFKEDLTWIPLLCSNLPDIRVSWYIFSKDQEETSLSNVQKYVENMLLNQDLCNTQNITVIDHRQNVGREGLAWAEYLLNDSMVGEGDLHLFLQGNMEISIDVATKQVLNLLYLETILPHFTSFHLICDPTWLRVDWIMTEYKLIIEDKLGIKSDFCWSARGEFIVTKPIIPKFVSKYKNLLKNDILPEMITSNNPPMGGILERIWIILFDNALREIS